MIAFWLWFLFWMQGEWNRWVSDSWAHGPQISECWVWNSGSFKRFLTNLLGYTCLSQLSGNWISFTNLYSFKNVPVVKCHSKCIVISFSVAAQRVAVISTPFMMPEIPNKGASGAQGNSAILTKVHLPVDLFPFPFSEHSRVGDENQDLWTVGKEQTWGEFSCRSDIDH